MTPQDYFNLALLLTALSLGFLIAAIVIRSKAKEDLAERRKVNEDTRRRIDDIRLFNEKTRQFMPAGDPVRYVISEHPGFYVGVFAEYKTPVEGQTTNVAVKRFYYTYDQGYALREAEYLLDTLNER